MNLKNKIVLLLIFLLALVFRFLYFPENTYFGFDQARDAFSSMEIINGHLKIIGPPTATQIFHHGVLYYYIFSPFYFFSGGDPVAVSVFLRVLNASGVFLIFLIALPIFGEGVAFLSSFLFAISYEQTQFALFLNHPSLAVISVLLFYLGLSTWIFRKKMWGFLLALFGLGLSIQFEFVEIQLIGVFLLFLLIFRKEIPKINFKNLSFAAAFLLIPLSTYLISEFKNNFLIIRQIPGMFLNSTVLGTAASNPSQILFIINRHISDNLVALPFISSLIAILLLVILSRLIFKGIFKKQLIFLTLWFFGGLLIYFVVNNDAYFYNTGTAISLLIFSAFLISRAYSKNKLIAVLLLILLFLSNVYLITKNNPLGPNQKINPQLGLLIKDQERVIDFIYQTAQGENFAVNALTMPYNVNTTWSYLFEWYGKKKYGYVPIWGGDAAEGFPGGLKVERARSKLPDKRYLIIEPLEGIPSYLVASFLTNEDNYTSVVEKKYIGTMQVWVQKIR